MKQLSILLSVVTLFGLGACGDDDDSDTPSAEACAAFQDFRGEVQTLDGMSVVQDGITAVQEQAEAVRQASVTVQEEAIAAAPDESKAFNEAVATLIAELGQVGDGEPSVEQAKALDDALDEAVAAGQTYADAALAACG